MHKTRCFPLIFEDHVGNVHDVQGVVASRVTIRVTVLLIHVGFRPGLPVTVALQTGPIYTRLGSASHGLEFHRSDHVDQTHGRNTHRFGYCNLVMSP